MLTNEQKVSLSNLARGAAIERFDDELARVLQNVLDPNAGDGVREILLRVRVKPSEDRRTATLQVLASSKVAPPKGIPTLVYLGRGPVGVVAFEHNPEQMKLPQPEKPKLVENQKKEGTQT